MPLILTAMPVEFDNANHCAAFVRLNEQWIEQHFALEEADRRLAADPYRIVREGGHILSLAEDDRVVGVCALVREGPHRYELARMAVDPHERGKGHGEALMAAAVAKSREEGVTSIYLLSNTVLAPAIALYRKHGFETVSEGPHPLYARCNIVMELRLASSA
jgi:N-acetylglutamate synthase-like GNAT family acetyltransferase